ncbi:conserved protein of unknown function [Candidatus Promineifilum breve]|uniref:Uncharacterized protein n=1 Tax=Candidatus Promineifilum breve TaxID=1806508 RepID=A0A160T0A4_9CHLR|nr:hypothetical protein [Candidatus Promineifilum breve]CUS03331.2 conserved protein of unknown function [Candidatus Promineifilum breve]
MTDQMRVTLEIGPKGKKVVAVAPDWPGLARGAKTGAEAIERLRSYMTRYSQVARLAEMDAALDATMNIDVVEEYPGTGSTDFWGISFAFSSIDKQSMTDDELARQLKLMQACWAFFDAVRGRVSAEMRKGPRGGGRDRDHIVRHTLAAEQGWAKGVGVGATVVTSDGGVPTDEALKAYRAAYCQAIRDYHSQGKMAGNVAKWPLRFLIRHTAFHTMDHAWEMEDKDLTGKEA